MKKNPWEQLTFLLHFISRIFQATARLVKVLDVNKKNVGYSQGFFLRSKSSELDVKGGFLSESNGKFSKCPKNVPKTILNYYIQYMAMIKYWFWIIYCKLKINIVLKFSSKNANDTAYDKCVKCFKHISRPAYKINW